MMLSVFSLHVTLTGGWTSGSVVAVSQIMTAQSLLAFVIKYSSLCNETGLLRFNTHSPVVLTCSSTLPAAFLLSWWTCHNAPDEGIAVIGGVAFFASTLSTLRGVFKLADYRTTT